MPPVVMGAALDLPGTHGQQRLAAVERLNLRFFVEAQHHGVRGRIDVQPHEVADLLDQQRVRRQLKGRAAMRLETKGFPDALDRHAAHPGGDRHRAGAPVGGAARRGLECAHDHVFHLRSGDLARRPRPLLIMQSFQSLPDENALATCRPSAG